MAIDELNSSFKKSTLDIIKKGPDTGACSIKVEDDLVKVLVPVDDRSNTGSNNGCFMRELKFPKREVRELFERLYSE